MLELGTFVEPNPVFAGVVGAAPNGLEEERPPNPPVEGVEVEPNPPVVPVLVPVVPKPPPLPKTLEPENPGVVGLLKGNDDCAEVGVAVENGWEKAPD